MKRLWCWLFHRKYHVYVAGYMDSDMFCEKCDPERVRNLK